MTEWDMTRAAGADPVAEAADSRASAPLVRAVVEAMLDPWVLLRAVRDGVGDIVDFEYADANEAACRFNGVSYQQLVGSRVGEQFPHLVEAGIIDAYAQVVRTGRPLLLDDYAFANPRTGDAGFYDNRGVRVGDGLSLTWRDVSDRHRAVAELAESRDRFRLLAENSTDIVFRTGPSLRIEWVSPSVTESLGWDPADVVGTPLVALLDPRDAAAARAAFDPAAGVESGQFEGRMRCADGSTRWMDIAGRAVTDESGAVGRVGRARDIEAEHRARSALVRSESRFRAAMESTPIGMATVDIGRRFTQVNPALCDMLGVSPSWLLARTLADVLHPDEDRRELRLRYEVQSGSRDFVSHETRLLRPDGRVVWVQHAIGLSRDDEGEPAAFVSSFVDVTAARETREQLRRLATRDPLTDLANRRELVNQIERLLARTPRTGRSLAVLFIDLDGLKPINDRHGHNVGDEVIVEVARRISSRVRAEDVVARFGGDEYVAVLPAVGTVEDANAVAEKIHDAVTEPVLIEGMRIPVSLSIGIAVADHGEDPQEWLRRADVALYEAKRTGRARSVVYSPDFDPVTTEHAAEQPAPSPAP